jgi:hypothetical protein
MTTWLDLSTIISASTAQKKLHLCSDLNEAGWTFWELRTLNRHRVVGLLREHRQFADASDLGAEIRSAISRNFKRAWWRGLAYGVIVELAAISWSPADLKVLVDIYENSKGVLQWVVLVSSDNLTAIGVHTWGEAYLSSVYRDTLQALTEASYHVTMALKGKDGLLNFLTAVSEWKGVAFPEFRDVP